MLYEDKKLILEKQDIKKDYKNLGGKSFNIRSCTRDGLSKRTLQAELLRSELLSSLGKIRFSNQEFATSTPVSNIK